MRLGACSWVQIAENCYILAAVADAEKGRKVAGRGSGERWKKVKSPPEIWEAEPPKFEIEVDKN